LKNYGSDLGECSNGLREKRTGVEPIRPEDAEYLWSIPEKNHSYPVIEGAYVNTKNWYMKENDLWAEFGTEISFGRRFSLKHSVRALAVGSTPSFGRRAVLHLEEEVFGNT
jgi:hypothetical protein